MRGSGYIRQELSRRVFPKKEISINPINPRNELATVALPPEENRA